MVRRAGLWRPVGAASSRRHQVISSSGGRHLLCPAEHAKWPFWALRGPGPWFGPAATPSLVQVQSPPASELGPRPELNASCPRAPPRSSCGCRAHMGLCYSLRPLLFGDPCAGSELQAEDAGPGLALASSSAQVLAPAAGEDAARTRLPLGAGGSLACARPKAHPKKERQRRQDQLRAEEREVEREARKVSRGIDRMLREQKRDLQLTHRLLLLGRCGRRVGRTSSGGLSGQPRPGGEGCCHPRAR